MPIDMLSYGFECAGCESTPPFGSTNGVVGGTHRPRCSERYSLGVQSR